MTLAVTTLTEDEASPVGRVNGVVDLPHPTRVSGWAIDRADPGSHVTVEVFREGRRIATVPATNYRADLEKGGVGSGRYGFVVDISPPVEPEFGFTITAIARTRDGESGDLRRIGSAAPSEGGERRMLEHLIERVAELQLSVCDQKKPAQSKDIESALRDFRHILERVETVQARQDENLLETPWQPENPQLAFLRSGVAIALILGTASLGLGVYSLWIG